MQHSDYQQRLKLRQELATQVEEQMITMLLSCTPANKLKVSDIQFIAACARAYTFDALQKLDEK